MVDQVLKMLFGKGAGTDGTPKCSTCKTKMVRQDSAPLFLLPVFHQDHYTPSAAFYHKHCWPITKLDQIPAGRRACRFWVFTCPACEQRKVLVEDFYPVKGTEVVKVRSLFEYREFRQFWEGRA